MESLEHLTVAQLKKALEELSPTKELERKAFFLIRKLSESAQKVALLVSSSLSDEVKAELVRDLCFLDSENQADPDEARPMGGSWLRKEEYSSQINTALELVTLLENPTHQGVPTQEQVWDATIELRRMDSATAIACIREEDSLPEFLKDIATTKDDTMGPCGYISTASWRRSLVLYCLIRKDND